MIYNVKKTETKNEYIVNTMVTIKVVLDNNQKTTQIQYDQNLLTKNEANALSNEFMTYFNALHQ